MHASAYKKGYGPLAIRAELQHRGLVVDDLDDLLATLANNWQDVIERVYCTKYKQPPDSAQEKAKRYRFLQQRGFTPTQIQTLFKQYLHYSPTDY
ncbi:RecX family transcriptional regulator [Methylocucumis oryzae]|uniref:RecX family transcriptional regulator n=1 Tax=Methylocucumis oryzae TaxID=1632867 RepID=UPI001EF9FD11|nr:RecX family transcriptional regulator [Methylocucumis oryzae]